MKRQPVKLRLNRRSGASLSAGGRGQKPLRLTMDIRGAKTKSSERLIAQKQQWQMTKANVAMKHVRDCLAPEPKLDSQQIKQKRQTTKKQTEFLHGIRVCANEPHAAKQPAAGHDLFVSEPCQDLADQTCKSRIPEITATIFNGIGQ